MISNPYYRNASGAALVDDHNAIKMTTIPVLKPEKQIHGKVLQEKLKAGNPRQNGLSSSFTDRIYPRIDFWKREQFYLTVGRVQNVVETFVLNIINREWYYDDTSEGAYQKQVEAMEQWEESIVLTKLLSQLVRNWIINGVNIISPQDWEFVQLQSIIAKSRDDFGKTTQYFQMIAGQESPLPASKFIEIPYIEFDREPWGVGMFDSLMNREYVDVDGREPVASLELYRQALQDNMKIHHKFASPRVVWSVPNASKDVIDEDIVPVIEQMTPGSRVVFNEEVNITQETVDGNARFIEHVNKIVDEIDTGLQSSANRIIAEPSAMADARAAQSGDDDRVLGIMERIRIFMNKEVIPKVTGMSAGFVEFKWGAKDAFELEFPESLQQAMDKGVLSKEQMTIILEEQYHWKIPTDEDVKERFGEIPLTDVQIRDQEFKDSQATKQTANDNDNDDKEKNKKESYIVNDIDENIKNEKLVAIKYINDQLRHDLS